MTHFKFWFMHFNGDHSLVQISLFNFLLINLHVMAADAVPTIVFIIENPVIRAQIYIVWVLAVFGFLLPWQWIGLVRAGWFEWTRLGNLGGILSAAVVSVFSTLLLLYYVAPSPSELTKTFLIAQERDGYSSEISHINETTLGVSGELHYGAASKIATLMRDGDLTTLEIDVTAGHLYEARRLSHFVKERGIDVTVNEVCLSPCTLVLASGAHRTAASTAVIGFQGYKVLYPDDRSSWFVEQNQQKDMEWLKEQGIDAALIQKSFYTHYVQAFWYPDVELLREKGWIDRISKANATISDSDTVSVTGQ